MTYERENEFVKKLENENYKGVKSLTKELEQQFNDMHYKNPEAKQRYINGLYSDLSQFGINKLDAVIELYNKDYPLEQLTSMHERMQNQESTINGLTVLFLQYGEKYGKENANVDDFIYGELKENLKNIKYDELQDIVDEVSKRMQFYMKEEKFDAGKEKNCIDAFVMTIKQYGKENLVRLRITNFELAEKQAKELRNCLRPDKDKFENLSKTEQEVERIKRQNEFKFTFRNMEEKMSPEDFQAVIKILDKTLNREERKALDTAVKFNNRENKNKYETRRIKLSESEKDSSWQKIEAESVRAKRWRDFRIELDELKRNKERGKDRYDTGLLNSALRAAINLENYIKKVANYISDSILYRNPEFAKDKNNNNIKTEPAQEQKNQASPFYTLMKEAYKEKGNELITLLNRNDITKEQAKLMFIKDLAYVSTLSKDQQDEILLNYTNSIAKGMQQPSVSIEAKNIIREFIVNYESGKYDSQIEKTAKEKAFDWSTVYQKENIKKTTENTQDKQQPDKKEQPIRLTENDKTVLETGELTKQAWSIGVKTAKEGDIQVFQNAISEFAHNHQSMRADQVAEYMTLSAAVALNYKHDTQFEQQLSNYVETYIKDADKNNHNGSNNRAITKLPISNEINQILALLEGATRIDNANRIEAIVNKKGTMQNLFAEEVHTAITSVLDDKKSDEKKQSFMTKLAERTFREKQQYFLALEANKTGFDVRTTKGLETKEKIDKKISNIAGAYENRARTNNDRINTSQKLIAIFERVTSDSIKAQEIYQRVSEQLSNNQKALNQLEKDAETYNKFKEKDVIDIKAHSLPKSILTHEIEEHGKLPALNPEELGGLNSQAFSKCEATIIDINIGTDELAKMIADKFNKLEPDAESNLTEWCYSHNDKEWENMIQMIDSQINNKDAAANFMNSVKTNMTSLIDTPNCFSMVQDIEIENPEEELDKDDSDLTL